MVQLNYIEDLHYSNLCKDVLGIDSLTHKTSMEFWTPIEEKVKERYGCSLSAYILYEHHFNEKKSLNEIAQEMGVCRQSLDVLVHKLNIPVRSQEESHTDRRNLKISSANKGKKCSKETLRYFSESHLRARGLIRPDDAILVNQYGILNMSTFEMARVWSVSNKTIYNWLHDAEVKMRRRGALRGERNHIKGKTYEEFYGEKEADNIKKKISDRMGLFWKNKRK